MFKPKLSLRNFFQKQAEEEQSDRRADVEVVDDSETSETETPDEEPDDKSDRREEESDDEETARRSDQDSGLSELTAQRSEETEASADLTAQATESIAVAELTQLRADAQSWAGVQSELTQLRTWYNTQKQGGKLPKADASDQSTTGKKSYEMAPWNQ